MLEALACEPIFQLCLWTNLDQPIGRWNISGEVEIWRCGVAQPWQVWLVVVLCRKGGSSGVCHSVGWARLMDSVFLLLC